jgi:hypothetical protein
MGSYRRDDYQDPETFVKGLIAVLARYPESVMVEVTDQARGIPSKLKWPPSLAEVVEACDKAMAPLERQRRRDEVFGQRREAIAPPSRKRETIEEMCARNDDIDYWLNPARRSEHPPDPLGAGRKPWEPRSLKQLAAEVGKTLTDEEIEAIPNDPEHQWKKLKWQTKP